MTGRPGRPGTGEDAAAALARGAQRASGERTRRMSTPLLEGARATPATGEPAVPSAPASPPAGRTGTDGPRETVRLTAPAMRHPGPGGGEVPPRHRPNPTPDPSAAPVGRASARRPRREPPGDPTAVARRDHPSASRRRATPAAEPPPATSPTQSDRPAAEGTGPSGFDPAALLAAGIDPAALVEAAVSLLRTMGRMAGLSTEEIEEQVATALAYLRRRLTGDYSVDMFGFDEEFTDSVFLPALRPLYRRWFRVEVRGVENLPEQGAALIVANHSGTLAFDALMTQVAVHDEHPAGRHLRMLGADLVFDTPFIGEIARKSGATLAAHSDAERLLTSGELVGVWPEGFKGIGKPFRDRYRLQRFGRGGFVAAAVRTGAPIVPCSIVGAEEIYPILANLPTVARILGVPYAPVTPTWPLLGLLGLVPLPSKWLIEFGEPVPTDDLGVAAADDPGLVFELTDRIRESIQQTLHSLLRQRRSAFF